MSGSQLLRGDRRQLTALDKRQQVRLNAPDRGQEVSSQLQTGDKRSAHSSRQEARCQAHSSRQETRGQTHSSREGTRDQLTALDRGQGQLTSSVSRLQTREKGQLTVLDRILETRIQLPAPDRGQEVSYNIQTGDKKSATLGRRKEVRVKALRYTRGKRSAHIPRQEKRGQGQSPRHDNGVSSQLQIVDKMSDSQL